MDGDVACDRCRAQRALVHCAEDAARLCLPCDVAAHAAPPSAAAHERAPLCDGCHAAPAAARCDDDGHGGRAAVCAACARAAAAACGHALALRPAGAYTGFPEVAELAHILAVDDYDTHTTTAELPSENLTRDAATDNDDTGEIITRALLPDGAAADDEHRALQGLDVLAGAHDGIINLPSWSELAMAPSAGAHLLSDQSSSMSTGTAKLELPRGDNPYVSMPMISPPPGGYQDQEKVETRMSRQMKRQRAMQRYNDKKKKRRFGCREIMYESRKATADTRERVKGRFAKAAAADSSTASGVRGRDVTGLPIQ